MLSTCRVESPSSSANRLLMFRLPPPLEAIRTQRMSDLLRRAFALMSAEITFCHAVTFSRSAAFAQTYIASSFGFRPGTSARPSVQTLRQTVPIAHMPHAHAGFVAVSPLGYPWSCLLEYLPRSFCRLARLMSLSALRRRSFNEVKGASNNVARINPSNGGQSEALTSARIILTAQGISVVSSVAGLIGLIIAYRALTKNTSRNTNTTRIPTIT